MGSGDSKIPTSTLDDSTIKSKVKPERNKYLPPFRHFGELVKKSIHPTLKEYVLPVEQPYREQFSIEAKFYKDPLVALNEKTQSLTIDEIFDD